MEVVDDPEVFASLAEGGWRSALMLVVVAAVLRAAFFGGLGMHDDIHYIERAHELSAGIFVPPPSVHGARLGLVIPPAVAFMLFGVSEITAVYFPGG